MKLSPLVRWLGFQQKKASQARPRPKSSLMFEEFESRFAPAVLTVGPSDSIQAAIDIAKAGDTIRVSGLHQENIVIANEVGHSRDNLKIEGFRGKATIQAPNAAIASGAIVEVIGAQNVSISHLTIQGPFSVVTGETYGIYVHGGGSARIADNHISLISDSPLAGNQRGVAIQVGASATDPSFGSAIIVGNVIDRYQKNGIQVSGAGSNASIEDNRIQGIGPNAIIAQNGIQIDLGASAKIRHNSISGNSYSPGGGVGSGIVINQPGKLTISENDISRNDAGVYLTSSNTGTIVSNNFLTGNTYGAILVLDTTGAVISGNVAIKNGVDDNSMGGIALSNSQNNRIEGNLSLSNKGFGISIDAQSTGNTVTRNQLFGNSVFDANDLTTGGAGNTWTKNFGKTGSPADLVKPGRYFQRFWFGSKARH